jgi:hypothetical protein
MICGRENLVTGPFDNRPAGFGARGSLVHIEVVGFETRQLPPEILQAVAGRAKIKVSGHMQ